MMKMDEDRQTDEEDMDTDSSLESGTSRISFRIRVAPDDSKKQVSVLMLTPQWQFDDYGMATITRSLVQNLRMIDPDGTFIKITCAVLEDDENISRDRKEDASNHKVQLVGYSRPRGDKGEPQLHWLDKTVANYYSGVAYSGNVSYDFIIGHAPYLINGCLNLKDIFVKRGLDCTAILVVHKLPSKQIGEINNEELKELADSDVLLSTETSIQEELLRRIVPSDQEKTPELKMYFPVFPVELFQVQREKRTERGGPRKILMITKERKNLKVDGLDIQLAFNSITEANPRNNTGMALTLLAEKNEKEEWESEGTLQCEVGPEMEDIKYHLKKADLFLLPLKASSPLFGSEALSAIAAGVPVLVSRHSPMGSLLLGMNANSSVVSETDVAAWGHRISQKIENLDTTQDETNTLKDHLLLDTSIPSTHMDFINLITGMCSKNTSRFITARNEVAAR